MPTVRPRGDKFQAIVRVKKGGVIVHQESRMFPSERLARDWGNRLEAKLKDEGVPQRQLSVKTLGQLLKDYLDELEKHKTPRRARVHELLQLSVEFEKVKLSELASTTFVEFAGRRRKAGTGPTTVLHNLATIRSVLNAAKPMFGLEVTGKPVSEAIAALGRVGAVGKSKSRERRPSGTELQAIDSEYQRIAGYPSTLIPTGTIVKLAVALPRRLGELLEMRWEDYDRRARTVKLRDTKHPVNPRDEVVPLPPEAVAIIDNLPVIDERMLPYKPESVSASFERVTARLGISDLHFHDLRHEGISRLFERGLAIQEVALISGHQSWAMLRRYTHPEAEQVARKLNKEPVDAHKQAAQEDHPEPA